MLFCGFFIYRGYSFIFTRNFYSFYYLIIFTSITVICSCRRYFSEFFILGQNNLTVIQKTYFNKKCTIYNLGELERIDFTYSRVEGKEAQILIF